MERSCLLLRMEDRQWRVNDFQCLECMGKSSDGKITHSEFKWSSPTTSLHLGAAVHGPLGLIYIFFVVYGGMHGKYAENIPENSLCVSVICTPNTSPQMDSTPSSGGDCEKGLFT